VIQGDGIRPPRLKTSPRDKPGFTLGGFGYIFGISAGLNPPGRIFMAEHILHKKESKKAPQKTLKEKRKEKKNKEKSSGAQASGS
jgi:hypothetical protein